MKGNKETWQAFKAVRPSTEAEVQGYVKKGYAFWDKLVEAVSELKGVQSLNADNPLPIGLRSSKGGDFLFRAIAFPILARCLKRAEILGINEDEFVRRFSQIPRTLSKSPWLGVIWDGSNMMIEKKNQSLAEGLILWITNCDPNGEYYPEEKLKKHLAEVLNKSITEISLPRQLS